jgi:5-methylcytosine-specific restriction endonuclease McrA
MDIEEQRQKKREYMRKYNATEKGRDYNRWHVKDYYRRNPEKLKEKRRKDCRSIAQEWKEAIIYYLVDRDGWNCFYCKKPVDYKDVSIGHKIARCLGGRDRLENFILCHKFCNYSDSSKARDQKKFADEHLNQLGFSFLFISPANKYWEKIGENNRRK